MFLRVGDNTDFRLNRLEKCIRIAIAVLSITPGQARLLIDEVRDDKGNLTVQWIDWPITQLQRHAFAFAWSECGEDGSSVQHVMKSDQ